MPNFPSHIRTILTQARHGQEAEYEKLSKPQQMVIDKDVQSIVEAAVEVVEVVEKANDSLGRYNACMEISAKLRGEEQA